MRNNVTFQYPAEFIPVSEEDGVLGIKGADWFLSLLRRIDGLSIESELAQEDWGIVVFAERGGKKFWIGLSFWVDDEQAWLAHFHHDSFAWIQRWTAAGNRELDRLISDFHSVLVSEPTARNIEWYHENGLAKFDAQSSTTPNAP